MLNKIGLNHTMTNQPEKHYLLKKAVEALKIRLITYALTSINAGTIDTMKSIDGHRRVPEGEIVNVLYLLKKCPIEKFMAFISSILAH